MLEAACWLRPLWRHLWVAHAVVLIEFQMVFKKSWQWIWFLDWFVFQLIGLICLIWLIWLIDCLIDWLVDWLDWFGLDWIGLDWLIGWLIGLSDWLIDWIEWLFDWMIGWMGRMIGLGNWLIDWISLWIFRMANEFSSFVSTDPTEKGWKELHMKMCWACPCNICVWHWRATCIWLRWIHQLWLKRRGSRTTATIPPTTATTRTVSFTDAPSTTAATTATETTATPIPPQ